MFCVNVTNTHVIIIIRHYYFHCVVKFAPVVNIKESLGTYRLCLHGHMARSYLFRGFQH